MIDVHCHIDLYPNPLAVAQRCEKAGVLTLAMTNLPSHFSQANLHLKGYRQIRVALGLHPLYVNRHKGELSLFEKYVDQTSYIGEVGLDFSREGISTKEQQIESFEYVLSKVRGKKKLLCLHSRGAEKATLNFLVKYNIKLAIFHWYTGSSLVLREVASHGYYFSINPAMLRSEKAKSLISQIPRQLILTETDGPYVQYENRIVEPPDVAIVIQYIAKLWKEPVKKVEEQIRCNFYSIIENLR